MKRPVSASRRLRIAVQGLSLGLFLACFALAAAGRADVLPLDLFFLADPLLAVSAFLGGDLGLPLGLVTGAALLLATTAFGGRFFCGYLCPMGACLDLASPRRRRPVELPNALRRVKVVLLGAVLLAAVLGLPAAWLLDPLAVLWRGLALALYPLGLASGQLALSTLDAIALPRRVFAGAGLSFALLASVLALNFIAPRFWCRALCPLGALLSLVSRGAWVKRRVDAAACVDCQLCAAACPMGDPGTAAECLVCLRCAEACPRQAIELGWGGEPAAVPLTRRTRTRRGPSRRAVLGATATGLAAAVLADRAAWAHDGGATALRPPGSLAEDDFLAACLRCGVCLQACPTNVLQPDLVPDRIAGFFAPRLDMTRGGCDPDCNLCGTVCPSQAIASLPLDEKRKAVIGTAVVDGPRCLRDQGEDCRICLEACPTEAVTVRGYGLPVIDTARCNGCGLCELRCPVAAPRGGRRAVYVLTAAEAARLAPPPPARDDSHLPPFLRGS